MQIQDNNAFLMAMGSGSRVEIHAADAAKDSWTQLDGSVSAGSSTLTLSELSDWEVGDKIVIASTSFDMNEAEYRTIVSISDDGKTITLNAPVEHDHFGEIESHNNGLTGEDFQSWELDMRAEVALLSRNVTIQGDADSAGDPETEQFGYGAHTMIMNGASMHIDGAELTRMGQIGEVGRYPLHWHMLGDASGQYVTNSSVHETYNKGVTIHGTQNTWLENNAIVNTIGHTYYFEDGSEFGNVLVDNLGMNTVKATSVEDAPIGSDHTEVSTYWVTNPNNHLIGNHAAGSDDTGFWVLSQDQTEGKSAESGLYDDYSPREQNPGTWVGNSAHTNVDDGFFVGAQFDESTGKKASEPRLEEPFELKDFTSFKNGEWGVWNRNGLGDFEDLKIADSNAGIQNWGDSNLRDSLFVGRSSNAADADDETAPDQYVGWQLYDHPFSFTDVHFAGYTGEYDAAISNGWGFGRSTAHSAEGLTFADDGTADKTYLHTLTIERDAKVSDQGGVIAGAIIDIDGSLTGTAGGVLTPGIIDYNPNKHYDIDTYAYEGIDAAGFNASEDAQWLADERAWIHESGTVIGKMAIYDGYVTARPKGDGAGGVVTDENGDVVIEPDFSGAVAQEDRSVFTVERSDNNAKILVNQDAMVSYSPEYQMNVSANEQVEYIFDFADKIPEGFHIKLSDLPLGAEVLYRFKGLPEGIVVLEADAAPTREAFDAADGTAWFREENGDYVVKAVADRYLHWKSPRTDTADELQHYYNDEFKLVIADADLYEGTPDGNPYTSREEHPFVAAAPDPVPERAESTSNTVEIAADDQRWSEATSWSGDVPGIDDIVVIGMGQRVVLNEDAAVKAILVNGGELVVEDVRDIALSADWILVINGGLFQVGTEDDPFQNDFTLTLEGDDAENDVNVMALMNSEDETVVRAVAYEPPQTTTETVVDDANARSWSEYTDTFDADGVRIQRETLFDDGRTIVIDYEGGIQTSIVQTDGGNAMAWTEIAKTYDANGKLASNVITYDNGRVTNTTYDAGVRESELLTDGGNVTSWTEIAKTYDANGKLATNLATYDDGRVINTTYEAGVRESQLQTDGGNAKTWTEVAKTYDAEGKLASNVITYDDGRVTSTNYEGGLRESELQTDGGNAKTWTEIAKTYDANGKIASNLINYDDGRVTSTTYEGGLRASELQTDGGNAKAWTEIAKTYDANGKLASNLATYDNGRVTTKTYEAGTIESSVITYPDGRVQSIDYEGGVRARNEVLDEGDNFLWSSQVTEFGKDGARESLTIIFDDGRTEFTSFLPEIENEVGFIDGGSEPTTDGPTFFDPFGLLGPADEVLG